MCKVWGVATRKGGVGKTTTSTTMAYLLAKAGYKVALIDFDGQRHSTKLSGVMLPEKLPITIYEILSSLVMGEELPEIETYIIHTESGVDLIPANNRLDYFDKLMCNTDFAEYKLKEYVDTIRDRYDYILIDGMESLKKLEQVQVRMVREFLCFKKQILSSRKKAYQLLTTELIHTFVKQIFVYQDKRVEIIFKFEDEMQYLMGKIASLCEGRASA